MKKLFFFFLFFSTINYNFFLLFLRLYRFVLLHVFKFSFFFSTFLFFLFWVVVNFIFHVLYGCRFLLGCLTGYWEKKGKRKQREMPQNVKREYMVEVRFIGFFVLWCCWSFRLQDVVLFFIFIFCKIYVWPLTFVVLSWAVRVLHLLGCII